MRNADLVRPQFIVWVLPPIFVAMRKFWFEDSRKKAKKINIIRTLRAYNFICSPQHTHWTERLGLCLDRFFFLIPLRTYTLIMKLKCHCCTTLFRRIIRSALSSFVLTLTYSYRSQNSLVVSDAKPTISMHTCTCCESALSMPATTPITVTIRLHFNARCGTQIIPLEKKDWVIPHGKSVIHNLRNQITDTTPQRNSISSWATIEVIVKL